MKSSDINDIIIETLDGKRDSSKHQITLFSLVLSLNAKNVLELGVRRGYSTGPLLRALEFTKGMLTSVDINDANIGFKTSQSTWKYVISDAIEFLENLKPDNNFDLIFIDDWHDGDHLYKEISLLEPHITPSTILAIHDCMCLNCEPDYHLYLDKTGEFANGGPYGAIRRLDKSKWEYCTIPVNNGLTLLRKPGKVLEF